MDTVNWISADSLPELKNNQVHIWLFDLNWLPESISGCLDRHNESRLTQLKDPDQRRRLISSRCQMRMLLALYSGIPMSQLEIVIAEGGKPMIDSSRPGLEFNLSHTNDLALLAVTRCCAVGIDIESVRTVPRFTQIAQRVFDDQSLAMLNEAEEDQQDALFVKLWTKMEARQKNLGLGVFAGKSDAGRIPAHSFIPQPGHVASLAWETHALTPELRYFRPDQAFLKQFSV